MRTAERRVAVATALLLYLAFVAYQSLAGGAPQPCRDALTHGGLEFSRNDALANFVAYVPLGLLVAAFVSGSRSFVPLAIGWIALSTFSLSMELLQACLSGRVSSWFDWSMNSSGALLGVLGKLLARPVLARGARALAPGLHASPTALAALLFIGAWLAQSTAPWRFTFDVGAIRANLAFLRRVASVSSLDSLFDPWLFVQHFFAWIAVAIALRAIAPDRRAASRWLLGVLAVSFAAQLLLVRRGSFLPALSFMELVAALSATVLCVVLLPRLGDAWLARLVAPAALVAVASYELAPVPGATRYRSFSWWPLLADSGPIAALQYASFFGWLAFALVLSLRWSAHGDWRVRAPVSVVLALFAMEIAQGWIPGRTPDTSPALLAAIAFLVGWVLTERVTDRDRATCHRCGV